MRQVADRIFLCLLVMAYAAMSLYDERSQAHMLMVLGGQIGVACIAVLIALSVATLLDTIINDVLPKQYTFHSGQKFRKAMWMWMGVTFAGLAFVAVRMGFDLYLCGVYTLIGMRCMFVAFIDFQEDLRVVQRNRRSTDRINHTNGGTIRHV